MTEPTDDELDAVIAEYQTRIYPQDMHPRFERAIMRAAIAKWGTQPSGVVNWVGLSSHHLLKQEPLGAEFEAVLDKHRSDLYAEATPPPTQAQAGAVPLTPIRQAALDLYKPPFRHEHGYIRDANNQMVSDDASSVATGLIAARIRGWGRIQYMDKPEMRANALQDEVAEMVAEALNAYWAANGIKGGQHGAE